MKTVIATCLGILIALTPPSDSLRYRSWEPPTIARTVRPEGHDFRGVDPQIVRSPLFLLHGVGHAEDIIHYHDAVVIAETIDGARVVRFMWPHSKSPQANRFRGPLDIYANARDKAHYKAEAKSRSRRGDLYFPGEKLEINGQPVLTRTAPIRECMVFEPQFDLENPPETSLLFKINFKRGTLEGSTFVRVEIDPVTLKATAFVQPLIENPKGRWFRLKKVKLYPDKLKGALYLVSSTPQRERDDVTKITVVVDELDDDGLPIEGSEHERLLAKQR